MQTNPSDNIAIEDSILDVPGYYLVQLSSRGNPDFGQDPDREVFGVADQQAQVGSLREASILCRAYISENGLGYGNWTGGQIFNRAGRQVAQISYNGGVWHPVEAGIQQQSRPDGKAPSHGADAKSLVTVYIEAYAVNDYADGLDYAKTEMDEAYLKRLRSLQALCITNGLAECRVDGGPDAWGPGDIENNLCLTTPQLIVTPTDFWFCDQPKHASYIIETRGTSIDELCDLARNSEHKVLFLGNDPTQLRDRIAEHEDLAAEPDDQMRLSSPSIF